MIFAAPLLPAPSLQAYVHNPGSFNIVWGFPMDNPKLFCWWLWMDATLCITWEKVKRFFSAFLNVPVLNKKAIKCHVDCPGNIPKGSKTWFWSQNQWLALCSHWYFSKLSMNCCHWHEWRIWFAGVSPPLWKEVDDGTKAWACFYAPTCHCPSQLLGTWSQVLLQHFSIQSATLFFSPFPYPMALRWGTSQYLHSSR